MARGPALAFAVSLPVVSCARGCDKGHPYTPYVIGTATEDPGRPGWADRDAALADATSPVTHKVAVLLVDGGAPSPALASVVPPAGERFVVALEADLDGDHLEDALLWAVPQEGGGGRLLFYRRGPGGPFEPPRTAATLAPGTIGVSGCQEEAKIEQIGKHSVVTTVRALCPYPLDSSVKSTWVAVSGLTGEPALREELRFGDPAQGESLRVNFDGPDLDGDGRDDLVAEWTLEGAPAGFEPSPPVTVSLRYFDRPAGLSRSPEEPEASFRAAVSAWAARAPKMGEAAGALAAARELTRLHAMLCAEEGVALLARNGGEVRCGPSRALEEVVALRARAFLALGDVPRAIAALGQASLRRGVAPRSSEIEKAVVRAAPLKTPTLRIAAVQPLLDATELPAWGPLMFAPAGDLLVRTRGGVVSIDPASGAERPAPGIPSWDSAVTSPDGAGRWLAAYDACDAAALRVRFGAASEPAFAFPAAVGTGRESLIPVLAPAPGRCLPGGIRAELDPTPVAWGPEGLEAWIAGEPFVLVPGAAQARPLGPESLLGSIPHAGSPRSTDGSAFALATHLGVLVHTARAWQLWRPGDREGASAYAGLRDCTAAKGGRAAACVRDGRVLLLLSGG